ncbi:hypothetical protein CVT24_002525, partial [Panaeolus cyanescens]
GAGGHYYQYRSGAGAGVGVGSGFGGAGGGGNGEEDRDKTLRGRSGRAGGGGREGDMTEHMSVYFVTSDEYALALAEESSRMNMNMKGALEVEYVDYTMHDQGASVDITRFGLGSIKPGPMVGSLSYKQKKERERVKKSSTPRLASLPRTSKPNSVNTSRREEKERERSFARITAPLSDKGKGKERAFIKPPSTSTSAVEETSCDDDESEEVEGVQHSVMKPPTLMGSVKHSSVHRLASSDKSTSSDTSASAPMAYSTPIIGIPKPTTMSKPARYDPPLSPGRLYIPPTSVHVNGRQRSGSQSQSHSQAQSHHSQAPSQSQSKSQFHHSHSQPQSHARKHPITSTPIEPKPSSTAPFHPTQSSGSTISTIVSRDGRAASQITGRRKSGVNTPDSVGTGTTTPPNASDGQAGKANVTNQPNPKSNTNTNTNTNNNTNTTSQPQQPQQAPQTLLSLLSLPTPPLTHLLPTLTALGITT